MHKRVRSFVIFMAGVLLGAVIYGNARRILSSPTAQTKTQRWEYRVVATSNKVARPTGLLGGTEEDELNRLGEQGFEICKMTQSGDYYVTVLLRRPRQ
jgi:hypothetical protein